MVSSVTLGNFFSSNGKTVLGGIGGSGLDTEALINSLVEAKSFPATQAQDKIDLNDKRSTALTELKTLVGNFQTAADALRNPPGVGNAASNAFKYTTTSVTSNTANAGSNFVTVTTSPGATLQSYSISEITSVASAASQSSGVFTVASANDDVVGLPSGNTFGAGNITIGSQTITIEATDSLNAIAAKFNAVSDSTGISATVIQISSSSFSLSFSATKTGDTGNFDLSTVTADPGVFDNADLGTAVAGTNAEFKINGVAVTRQSNSINDLISGLTFNILQETAVSETLTVSVKADTATAKGTIQAFVDSYNAIRQFVAEQTQLSDDGTYAEDAVLANDPTFQSVVASITNQISAKVSGLTGSYTSLASIGITFTDVAATADTPTITNALTIDDGKLTSALSSSYADVTKLFGLNLSTTNPNVALYSSTNSVKLSSFTLNIDPVGGIFQAIHSGGTINLTATALPGSSGYTLSGPAGSLLEGLSLIYASTTAGTSTINFTQGVAALTYNTSDAATETNTGTLALALKGLEEQNTKLSSDITQINTQVDQYREQLLAKFAALEQAISRVNNLLQSLSADSDARNNAAG